MTNLRFILEQNRVIIQFGYGLVFFVMGLSIALQMRRYSRLDLALSLKWLAIFGVTHGIHEWGDMFIPIQRAYLSDSAIQILYILQLILLGISFAALLEFGLALIRPFRQVIWLYGVSISVLLGWVFVSFFVLLPLMDDLTSWHHTVSALARYFIGFPAGILAAFGLRYQTYRRIAPLNVPHIISTLRVAGLALFCYAILGGLIPPPVGFFPGNIINSFTFTQVVGVPPLVFRSLTGLILLITIVQAMDVFELETTRLIESMQQNQILAAERDRIGRELHDGAIQKVYTAGLLVQSAASLAGIEAHISARLNTATEVLNDAISDLRNNLGQLRDAAAAESLLDSLQRFEADPRYHSLFDIVLETDNLVGESISPMRANHVFAILNEALSNVARHAHAQQVKLIASRTDERFILIIQDDGAGLPNQMQAGFGLRNMRDRARLLGGQIEIQSTHSKGTLVKLDIPWKDER